MLTKLPGKLVLAVVFATVVSSAQDYLVKPVPASFNRDNTTTFLLDLTSPKSQADFSLGNSALVIDPAGFVPGVGYRGTVGFSTAGNFPTNAWTVEMIIQVPYAAASLDPIMLASWSSDPFEFHFDLHLEKGFGVRSKLYCWNSQDYFLAQPYAGGNGRSIQASATDKQVYVAFGFDFTAQQYLASAREVGGDILNQDINFVSSPVLDTSFLSGFQVSQQAPELARRWQAIRTRFAQSMPATFTLGNPAIQIKAIRLSNRYRPELFQVAPLLPQAGPVTWTPQSLSPTRATDYTVLRTVGYPGNNNSVSMLVDEPYLPLAAGASAVSIQLTNVPVGLYTFYVYGSVSANGRTNLNRVWQPCPMEFEAHNSVGQPLAHGHMLLKQSFSPRRMQGFHVHVDKPGDVTATFRLPANATETAWLQQIVLVDQLEGLPDVAIKRTQNLAIGASNQLSMLSVARMQRDDAIWNTLPPLNTHLQVPGQVAQFSAPPVGATVNTWVTRALENLPVSEQPPHTFDSLDFRATDTGTVFPQNLILAGDPWPGAFPDDGTGVFFRKAGYPSLATDIYNTKRAELLGYRYLLYAGAITDSRGSYYGLKLPAAYFSGGDANTGHDAALALVRWAYDWPALEMSLHEIRLSTHSPDFEYNTDWSSETRRNGKMYYVGWSGFTATWLFEAYDQVFPYIKDNQAFADAVHRFIPWVNTPNDVVRMLDRYLVWSSVRDVKRGLIDGAAGIADAAGSVLGPHPLTAPLFDQTRQYAEIYPATGTYQEMYGTALSRSGVYYIASYLTYAFGSAQDLLNKAYQIKKAREAGIPLLMDLSNVARYPKVRGAGNFLLDMWVAGGFPFTVGDASGGPHTGLEANLRLGLARDAVSQAFDLYGDPRHAWVLKNLLGNTNGTVAAAASTVSNPVLYATSRVVPDYGAILELSPQETNLLKKTSATLRLGIGQGHSHNDYLDLNLFGMGLPLAVDLACRNEGNNWSRPNAGWSFLHNHALAHDSDDPNGAGTQSGEPWLNAFAPPLVRAAYVDQSGGTQLDRDVLLMEVGSSGEFYAFDVQRLRGGTFHTWSFHGCESDTIQLNVPMQSQTVRWTDRTLEGTQKVGMSTDNLQATWTMTRATKSFAYSFNGGGTLHTVDSEPTVLGARYNPALPEVRVRATLLGRGADTVLQGNPYSDVYSYCFPFLWVQSTNEAESVYPAVYEWYRGNTPVIAEARILQTKPLTVRVATTSGQVDTYESTPDYFLAVSRNPQGLRWAKLSGYTQVSLGDLSLNPGTNYDVAITDIDYLTRHLTTSGILPANPSVSAGNNGRRVWLKLQGSGTSFNWNDDLLVAEGAITDLRVTGPNTVSLTANQQVLFAGTGNRKADAMTVTTEDGLWHFRGGSLIRRPVGLPLTPAVFSDANGDGFVDVKTYEIGGGDRISLPVEVEIVRTPTGWRVRTNVALGGAAEGAAFSLPASGNWQDVASTGQPRPPSDLRVLLPN